MAYSYDIGMKWIGFIMTLLVLGVIVLCVCIFCLLPEDNVTGTSGPLTTVLRVEQDTLILGIVEYEGKCRASFRLHNTGEAPLLIRDVKPSCGCTAAEWSKSPLRPGEATEISIIFKPVSLGHFMKSIDVVCNTVRQVHKLYLKGEVVESVKD